jgi:hypothetical protein
MSKHLVDIHIANRRTPPPAGDYIDDRLTTWGRHTLALEIAERGMEVVFSRGPEAYDFDSSTVSILRPRIEKVEGLYKVWVKPDTICLSGVHAIRNITKVIGNGVPELNNPNVRAITRDKLITNNLLGRINLSKAYAAVDQNTGIGSALEALHADAVVLKSRRGSQSRNIHVGDKVSIANLFNSPEIDKESMEWLVEEKLDFSPKVLVKGMTQEQQDKIDYANSHELPKELRIYSFGRDDEGRLITSPILRIAQLGDSNLANAERFGIDPESVPEELWRKTDEIVSAIEDQTGVKEVHLAVDWAYALRPSTGTIEWLPMEINSGEPALMEESEDAALARDHAGKLADQLYRVAQHQSTTYQGVNHE